MPPYLCPSTFARPWSRAGPAPDSWHRPQTNPRPLSALRPLHPSLRTSALPLVTPFPVETNVDIRVSSTFLSTSCVPGLLLTNLKNLAGLDERQGMETFRDQRQ